MSRQILTADYRPSELPQKPSSAKTSITAAPCSKGACWPPLTSATAAAAPPPDSPCCPAPAATSTPQNSASADLKPASASAYGSAGAAATSSPMAPSNRAPTIATSAPPSAGASTSEPRPGATHPADSAPRICRQPSGPRVLRDSGGLRLHEFPKNSPKNAEQPDTSLSRQYPLDRKRRPW